MSNPVASLPMYDWPEVRADVDGMWTVLKAALNAQGIDAPEQLTRDAGLLDVWRDPHLVFSQACGWPYLSKLAGHVQLIGGFDMGYEDCPRGYYQSHVVVHKDSSYRTLDDLRDARFAANGLDSQSGYRCLLGSPCAQEPALISGSHRGSIVAVAGGDADFAAIDVECWRLAARFVPAFAKLRVLTSTTPKPGMALITGKKQNLSQVRQAVIAALPELEVFGVKGFVNLKRTDYTGLL